MGRFLPILKSAGVFEENKDWFSVAVWVVVWAVLLTVFTFFGIFTNEDGFMCVDENIRALNRLLRH